MPILKQITCSIELGSSKTKLKEYGARYSDGAVETFIAVPETKLPFYIRLESKGYIAPGLAAFVFMDGEYQCNRNRLRLMMPGDDVDPSKYEVDFCLRQKEEKARDGKFVGREWTFAELNTTTADNAATLNPNFMANFATIEIVVLRCKSEGQYIPTPDPDPAFPAAKVSHSRQQSAQSARHHRAPSATASAKAKSSTPAASEIGGLFGLFDGANDLLKGQSDIEPITSYDGTSDADLPMYKPIISYDGTNDAEDHRAVAGYGSTSLASASDLTWDYANGRHRRRDLAIGGRGAHRDDRPPQTQLENADVQEQAGQPANQLLDDNNQGDDRNGQLDGMGGPYHQMFVNPYGQRGVHDMNGDKYLGLVGNDRREQKGHLRAQGYQVSESASARGKDPNMYRQAPPMPDPVHPYGFNGAAYMPPNSNLQQTPVIPAPQGICLDCNGDLKIDGRLKLLRKDVPIVLEKLVEAVQEGQQKSEALQNRLVALPQGHPDAVALWQRISKLNEEAEDDMSRYNRVLHASQYFELNEAVKDGQPNVRNEDGLVERWQAQQNTKAARQGGEGGFKQVGEGAVGGGASYNQRRQMLPREKKPSNQEPNQTDRTKADKHGNRHTNDWAGAQQENNAAWGGEAQNDWGNTKAESVKSQTHKSSGGKDSTRSESKKSRGQNNNPPQDNGGDGGWGSPGNGDQGNQGNSWENNNQGKADDPWNTGGGGDGSEQATPPASASQAGGFDLAAVAPEPRPKAYWSNWKQASTPYESSDPNTKKKREEPRQPYQYPAAHLPSVPEGKVKDASHGIQAGKGADYSHRCHRPNYLDEMSAPYAVFSFKYRSKTALEKILKLSVAVDTDATVAEAEKQVLLSMPRDRLLEELMKMKVSKTAAPRSSASEKKKPASDGWGGDNGGGNATGWANGSELGKSNVGGWDDSEHGKSNAGWNNASEHGKTNAARSHKSTSNKGASAAGRWARDNNAQRPTNKWADPPVAADGQCCNNAPAANGGWDGGNDAMAKVKALANQDIPGPTTRDFAYPSWRLPHHYTPQPVENYTTAPVDKYAPAPVDKYTPAPVVEYDPATVDRYIPTDAAQEHAQQPAAVQWDFVKAKLTKPDPPKANAQLTKPKVIEVHKEPSLATGFSRTERGNHYRNGQLTKPMIVANELKEPSLATGFTRPEGHDHPFNGNREFVSGARGGRFGRGGRGGFAGGPRGGAYRAPAPAREGAAEAGQGHGGYGAGAVGTGYGGTPHGLQAAGEGVVGGGPGYGGYGYVGAAAGYGGMPQGFQAGREGVVGGGQAPGGLEDPAAAGVGAQFGGPGANLLESDPMKKWEEGKVPSGPAGW